MSITLNEDECAVQEIGGVTVFAFSIGTELEVEEDWASMPGESNGKELTVYNLDNDVIHSESFFCTNCWNGGFALDLSEKTVTYDEISFSDDTIAIVGSATGFTPSPANWPSVAGDPQPSDFTSNMELNVSGTASSYCPGATDTVDVGVVNAGFCDALKNTSVTVTNELTGNTQSVTFTEPSGASTGTVRWTQEASSSFEFDIPSDAPLGAGVNILTIEATSDAPNSPLTESVTVTIGNTVEDLFFDEIPDISGVCPGDRFEPDVTARNSGDCESEVSLEITNDFNDDVIEAGPTSLGTGGAEAGSTDFFISGNIPDAPKSVDTITYTAELFEGGRVVETQTFTVDMSQAQVGIANIESPNQACAGEDINFTVNGENTGDCDGSGTAVVTNNINEEVIESSPTSLRSGSTRGIRLEDTIPSAAADAGAIQYTATLMDSEGNQAGQETFTINIGSTSISLQNAELPSTACAGQTVDGQVEVSNTGECPSDVTVAITQESTGETEALETISVRDGSSRTVRFTQEIPLETIELDQDTFTLSAQVPSPEGNLVTDTIEQTLDIASTDINMVGTTSPAQRCVGGDINVTFTVANSGGCEGEYRILATDSITQSEQVVARSSLGSERRDTVSLQDTMPPQAIRQGGITYSFELQSRIAGSLQTVEEGEVAVGAQTSNIEFGTIEVPEQQCIGTAVQFRVPFENSGQCDTEYRIQLNDVTRGQQEVVDQGTITSGNATTARFQSELGPELSEDDTITFDINLQKRLNQDSEWQTEVDVQRTITILKPNVSVTSTNYPDFAIPGEKQYEVEVTNDSQCSTNIDVTIAGQTENLDISPQSTLTITDSFTLAAQDEVREIAINDNTLNAQVDSFQTTIEPHQFVNLDQSRGVLVIKGGFENEAVYSGSILGSSISAGSDLEEEDILIGQQRPRVGGNTFKGTATTDSTDTDTIRYRTVKGVNIQLSETVSIVVDGEVRGRSQTFRHTTVSSSLVGFGDDSTGGIQTSSGPLASIGGVRRQLDFEPEMLSGPIFTIDR